MLWKECKD